jgi:peptidoglycan-associated lipoprotein
MTILIQKLPWLVALGAAGLLACAHEKITENKPAEAAACPTPAPAPVCAPSPAPICAPAALHDCGPDLRRVVGQTVLHFDFDKHELTTINRKYLDGLADALQACPAVQVVIEGNCDERGTKEYNLHLGQRRADVAKQYLVRLGVNEDRIGTVSYGLERPADDRHNEEAWAMNRRDDFSLKTAPAVSSREEEP